MSDMILASAFLLRIAFVFLTNLACNGGAGKHSRRMEQEGIDTSARTATISLGVVIRKQPGVTRWAKWNWRAVAVLPGVARRVHGHREEHPDDAADGRSAEVRVGGLRVRL